MGTIISSVCFLVFVGLAFYFAYRGFHGVYSNIMLGRPEDLSDNRGERFKTMMLVAFGQKKMFKRPVAAILHFVIYSSFIITQVELIEIFIDGAFGTHRIIYHAWEHSPALRSLYVFAINFIEVLSVLTFAVTLAFLYRRDLLKLKRLNAAAEDAGRNRDDSVGLPASEIVDRVPQTSVLVSDAYIESG